MSNDDLALRVAALKVVKEFTAGKYEEARAEIAKTMGRGDRLMARSPLDDSKIGAVSMSDPKPTAKVTNESALMAWLAQHYPEHIHNGYEINATTEQVTRVLFEHAPHLLQKVRRIKPDVLSSITKASAALGQPVGPGGEADVPGITVETPDPVVSCKPADDSALTAVMDLIRAERLGIDGVVRPEIPASEDPSAA